MYPSRRVLTWTSSPLRSTSVAPSDIAQRVRYFSLSCYCKDGDPSLTLLSSRPDLTSPSTRPLAFAQARLLPTPLVDSPTIVRPPEIFMFILSSSNRMRQSPEAAGCGVVECVVVEWRRIGRVSFEVSLSSEPACCSCPNPDLSHRPDLLPLTMVSFQCDSCSDVIKKPKLGEQPSACVLPCSRLELVNWFLLTSRFPFFSI